MTATETYRLQIAPPSCAFRCVILGYAKKDLLELKAVMAERRKRLGEHNRIVRADPACRCPTCHG